MGVEDVWCEFWWKIIVYRVLPLVSVLIALHMGAIIICFVSCKVIKIFPYGLPHKVVDTVPLLLIFKKKSFASKNEAKRGPERSCRINTQGGLISARETSHKYNNKDLSHLRRLSPDVRVNTRYKNSARGTSSGGSLFLCFCDVFPALINSLLCRFCILILSFSKREREREAEQEWGRWEG